MEHDIQELQDAQDDIRWDKFMFGNISVLWQEIQAQYFREIGKRTQDCGGKVSLPRRFGKWHGTNGNKGMKSYTILRILSHKQNQ
jgi:hypothetical protein